MQLGEWKRSSLCDNSGSCVEVARLGDQVAVRDGKLGDASPVLKFDGPEWKAFVGGILGGEF
jgi:hypothetical protein